MNPLASRRQLLIAESELNRAQLLEDCHTVADGVRGVAGRARTIITVGSAAGALVAGWVSFRRLKSAPAGKKPSWGQTMIQGAQLAAALWSECRPRKE